MIGERVNVSHVDGCRAGWNAMTATRAVFSLLAILTLSLLMGAGTALALPNMASDKAVGASPTEILFVDTGVADWPVLATGANRAVEVIPLDAKGDGVEQIAEALAGRSGLNAVHVISHGNSGRLLLGANPLDRATLGHYSKELSTIGAALSPDGGLLLYGCNVAQGKEGKRFVDSMAMATGTAVVASSDLTGSPNLGGNWELEYVSGGQWALASARDKSAFTSPNYEGLLGDVTIGTNGAEIWANSNGFIDAGQSFTATKTGVLKSVGVASAGGGSGGDWTLSIYAGEGTAGTLLHTQTGASMADTETAPNYTLHVITISPTVELTSGSKYTFVFTPAEAINLGFTQTDEYAGGSFFSQAQGGLQTGYDLIFEVVQGVANAAPTITVPSVPTTVHEDSTGVDIGDFVIADTDGDAQTVTVTSVGGTASLGTTTGLTGLTGNGTDSISFSGSVADTNTALASLTFSPTADHTGAASVTVATDDSAGGTDSEVLNFTVNAGPTVSSIVRTGGAGAATNADSLQFDVTFSGTVTGVNAADFAVTGTTGTVTNVEAVSGTLYRVTVSGGDLASYNGTAGLNVADDDTITLASGAPLGGVGTVGAGDGSYSTGETYTVDNTAPQITAVSVPNTTMKVGDVVTATITVASDADTYTLSSGTIDGFALSSLSKTNDTTYTAQFTVTQGGTDVLAGSDIPVSLVLADTVGNQNTAYTTAISQTGDPINANSPTDIALSPSSLTTGATGSNAEVGTLSASDASPVDTFTYTLVAGTGDTHNASFSISGDSLRNSASLSAGNYTIRVQAIDAGGNSFAKALTVEVVPTYTVTYDGNGSTGGTVPTDGNTYEQGATVTVLDNSGSLVRTGYTFAGWNTAANRSGIDYAASATFTMGTANVTLYAKWIANPSVSSVDLPADGSYRSGQTLSFTVNYSEAVDVTGTPRLTLTLGSTTGYAAYVSASSTSTALVFSYIVQSGDDDGDGIAVGANIDLNGGTIKWAGSATDADLALGSLSTAGIKVDTVAPAVTGTVAVPADASYAAGDTLDFTVSFDEDVTLSGTASTLGLSIGSASMNAAYLSNTASSVSYRYTVQTGDLDADGIAIGAIALGGDTLRDAAGNDADTALSGHLPSTAGVLVDGVAPAVFGTLGVPADGTYVEGANLDFTVTFAEAVTLTGTSSSLGLSIGGASRQAAYLSKTATTMTYRYSVQAGDNDSDGIAVGAITLNTDTLQDGAGNDADLSLAGHLPSTAGILVDTQAPSVSTLSANPAAIGLADVGSPFTLTVGFSEPMDTTVNPTLSFPTGGEDPGASLTFASGSWPDNQTYVASYTVTDANQELAAIDVSVSGAQDAIGNAMSTHLEPDVFAIDTLNDAPVGGNLNQTVSYTEGDTNVDLSPTAISVSDADAGEQLTATLTLADSATGTLSGGGGSYDSGTGVWSFSGTATEVQSALNAVLFNPQTDNEADTSVSVSIADGGEDGAAAASGTLTLEVAPVNDAPSLTASALDPTFFTSAGAVTLFGSTSADTHESGQHFTSLTLTVGAVADGATEELIIDAAPVALTAGTSGSTGSVGYSVSVAGSTATVSLTGTLSNSQVQTLVDSLAYRNGAATPTGSTRTVTLTEVRDSGGSANGGVDTTALNIASTLTIQNVGVQVTPTAGLITGEDGTQASFELVLISAPTADVSVGLTLDDTTEGSLDKASVTFTPANWNVAQTVTVTGLDDAIDDGDVAYKVITATTTSSDPVWNALAVSDVALTNQDDADTVGVSVSPTSGLETREDGTSAGFTVVLDSEPTADVTLPITSNDPGEGEASPDSLTFTPANWNVAQTVTVSGVDDTLEDGDIAYSVSVGDPQSTDPLYDALSDGDTADVSLTNRDDDHDADGAGSGTEQQVPGVGGSDEGDGNGDGEQDSIQSHVTSIQTGEGDYVTLANGSAASGYTLSEVTSEPAPTDAPAEVEFPYGQLRFNVDVGAAGSVQMDVYVPYDPRIIGYYKWNRVAEQWQSMNATVSHLPAGSPTKTRLTFTLTDGDDFDMDDAVNGSIQDPGGPVVRAVPAAIPALSLWGLGALAALLGGLGALRRRGRRVL